ncbi:hypothetical protein [Nocardia sp. NPDC005978]|uniref:hypothetical protein n=1 Tax=unclassified Nocardia TaxID=2637762 RepID=UPI0033BC48BD
MAAGDAHTGKKPMGRKSLGPRHETKVRYPQELDLQDLARTNGYTSVNQFMSDMLCVLAGRPDLATPQAVQTVRSFEEFAQAS